MSEQDLYNKFRPSVLSELKGQDHVTKLLSEYIKTDSVPHSMIFTGPAGTGKAQPLYSKVKTPTGWTTIGEVREGDKVLTHDGKVTEVIGTFDRGIRDVYEVEFVDGRTARCCNEHLWKVHDAEGNNGVVSLDWIMKVREDNLRKFQRLGIDLPLPYSYRHRKLPLNPYLLGALIGDGYLGKSIMFSSIDEEVLSKVSTILRDFGYKLVHSNRCDYRVVRIKSFKGEKALLCRDGVFHNEVKRELKSLGLLFKKSYEKFIPEQYLHSSSVKQKYELLRGLMDTDGTAGKEGSTSFCTTSPQLAKDVLELCRSLGHIASVSERFPSYSYEGVRRKGRKAYIIHIRAKNKKDLFCLTRKKDLVKERDQYSDGLKLRFKSIKYIGKELVKCIAIKSLHQLYITDNYVVTHNTSLARIIAKALNENECGCIEVNSAVSGKVDDMRGLERDVAHYPMAGESKTYIFDEAHRISSAGFDSLLKTVEEPPSHVNFIFVTTNRDAIPSTILSRSDVHQFNRIASPVVRARLQEVLKEEGVKLSDELVDLAVEAGSGSLRDALVSLQKIIVMYKANETQIDIVKTLGIVGPKGLGDFCKAFLTNNLVELRKASACFDPSIVDPIRAVHSLQQFVLDARHCIYDPEYVTKSESNVEEFITSLDKSSVEMQTYNAQCLLYLFDTSLVLESEMSQSSNAKGLIDRFVIRLEASRAQ